MRPLAIDSFCGLGGWTDGLLAEGYRVVGFDNERHRYPERIAPEGSGTKAPGERVTLGDLRQRGQSRGGSFNYTNECAWREQQATGRWAEYPAQLVIQDVLTLHGRQFKDAALIVASPPCQAYSYRAMPWKRAKALPPPSNELFDACFRIQREACEAAGHHIPLVVENVCGAQKWVGRARWHYGSFYLWGDVPALMPIVRKNAKASGFSMNMGAPKWNMHHKECVESAIKNDGGSWFAVAHNTTSGHGQNLDGRKGSDGGWFNDNKRANVDDGSGSQNRTSSKSTARKAASAHIAKIPLVLARHIARSWRP